jgi:hypothetical protein
MELSANQGIQFPIVELSTQACTDFRAMYPFRFVPRVLTRRCYTGGDVEIVDFENRHSGIC